MHTLYTRINTGILVFIALTGIVLVTMMATRAYGGPLDPPGAPAPTMKTLQQVEPRTPISQPASFPIQINASGSYYLTENITGVPGQHGIVINASNVTMDLNGFTLYGGGGEYGITDPQQAGFWQGLTIRNGAIKGWDTGVWTSLFSQSTYEDLNVSNNSWGLVIGSGSNVRRVVAWNNNVDGLRIHQVPGAWGSIVEDSNFSRNGGLGIFVAANNVLVHDNVVHSNGAIAGIRVHEEHSYNEIIDNSIIGNVGVGVILNVNSTGNVVAGNTLVANTTGALTDSGTGNHVGEFVGGASLLGGNQYSNIVY